MPCLTGCRPNAPAIGTRRSHVQNSMASPRPAATLRRRAVALKVLPFAATMDARHLQRFHNEPQAAACLHHTNIAPVYYVGCERCLRPEGGTVWRLHLPASIKKDGPEEIAQKTKTSSRLQSMTGRERCSPPLLSLRGQGLWGCRNRRVGGLPP
jgi:hypothetical protein